MDLSARNSPEATAPKMETVDSCPLCHSSKAEFLFWNYDRLYNFKGKFGTLRCRDCGLIRLSPRPAKEQLAEYYPGDYYSYQPPVDAGETSVAAAESIKVRIRESVRKMYLSSLGYPIKNPLEKPQLIPPFLTNLLYKRFGFGHKFPRFVPQGIALEVGCGSATYLNILKRHGWRVKGLDLVQQASRAAKKHFDIDVFVGELQNAPFAEDQFDYILMSHVVEHFTDPVQSMKKIREILKPHGVAYIEVPNAESFAAKKSGKFWYGWDAPRHLFMYSPSTLKKLVNKSGLKVKKMITHNWNSFDWDNTFKLESELDETFNERPHRAKKHIPGKVVARLANRVNHLLKPDSGYNIGCWVSMKR